MSDYQDFESDNFEDDQSPAGLRKALKKAQQDAKKAREELEAERTARASAEKVAKKSTLTQILASKKVPAALAKWLEKDEVEATPEAVDGWLKENGELFNLKPRTTEPDEQTEEQDEPEDEIPEELANQLRSSQALDASGVSPSAVGTMQRLASLSTDRRKVTYDDLVSQLKDMGAPLD